MSLGIMHRLASYFLSHRVIIIAVVLMILAGAWRVYLLPYVYNQKPNMTLSLMNAEVGRNIAAGRGAVVDQEQFEYVMSKGTEENKIIDTIDAPLKNHIPHYASFSSADEVGYPLFLGILWKLTPPRLVYASIFQIILSMAATLVLFLTTQKLFSSLFVATIASLIYVKSPFASLSITPIQHAWVEFILIFTTGLLVTIYETKSSFKRNLALLTIGILCGIGTLMRSTLLFLPFVAVLCFFIQHRWKSALRMSLVVVSVWALILTPNILRNQELFGEPQPVRKVFWHIVALGLSQYPNPWQLHPNDLSIIDFAAKKGVSFWGLPLYESYIKTNVYENYIKTNVVETVKLNPLWYFGTIIERVPMTIFPFHWAMIQGKLIVEMNAGQNHFYSLPFTSSDLFGFLKISLLALFGIVGMIFARKKWLKLTPVWILWFYLVASYSIIFVHPGYMAPAIYVYGIFGAYAAKIILTSKISKRILPDRLSRSIDSN